MYSDDGVEAVDVEGHTVPMEELERHAERIADRLVKGLPREVRTYEMVKYVLGMVEDNLKTIKT